jgi:hypothetical protein
MITAVTVNNEGSIQLWRDRSIIQKIGNGYIDACTNGSTVFALRINGRVTVFEVNLHNSLSEKRTWNIGDNSEEGVSISCGGGEDHFKVVLDSGRIACCTPRGITYEGTRREQLVTAEKAEAQQTDLQEALHKCKGRLKKRVSPTYEYAGYGLSAILLYKCFGIDHGMIDALITLTIGSWAYFGKNVMGQIAKRWNPWLVYLVISYLVMGLGDRLSDLTTIIGFLGVVSSIIGFAHPLWPFALVVGHVLAAFGGGSKGRDVNFGGPRINL